MIFLLTFWFLNQHFNQILIEKDHKLNNIWHFNWKLVDIVVQSETVFDVKIWIVNNLPSQFGQLGTWIVEDLIPDHQSPKLTFFEKLFEVISQSETRVKWMNQVQVILYVLLWEFVELKGFYLNWNLQQKLGATWAIETEV